MADPALALTLQLLEWISDRPRGYADVVEAWRSTCPRLSIWEDACIDGLIDCDDTPAHIVTITDKGRRLLADATPAMTTIDRAPERAFTA